MGDQVSCVEPAHGMRKQVDLLAPDALVGLEQLMKRLCPFLDRPCPGHLADDDFAAELVPEDLEDLGPVVDLEAGEGIEAPVGEAVEAVCEDDGVTWLARRIEQVRAEGQQRL